jgi:hypothetical protein
MVTQEQIKALAYSIWEQEGCHEDKNQEHYYRAKQILEKQEATGSTDFEQPPAVINLTAPKKGKSPTRRKNA